MKELKEKIEALKQQYINEREYAKGALLRDIEKDLFPEPKWKVGDKIMSIGVVEDVTKGRRYVKPESEDFKIAPAEDAYKWIKEGDTVWVEMKVTSKIFWVRDYSITVSNGDESTIELNDRTKIAYKP